METNSESFLGVTYSRLLNRKIDMVEGVGPFGQAGARVELV